MKMLNTQTCTVCQAGAPQLTTEQITNLSKQIPDWKVIEIDDEKRLRRMFRFDDFAQPVAFIDCIAD
ncbi:MAG: 4a-hydroxytetrahydrobiopterin dehydratase [Verrucomicrobiota bacterium]|nr:4a-hydroxytetrahydrobiopterin dehydratase [Verrucomicrobiota bacterium]